MFPCCRDFDIDTDTIVTSDKEGTRHVGCASVSPSFDGAVCGDAPWGA